MKRKFFSWKPFITLHSKTQLFIQYGRQRVKGQRDRVIHVSLCGIFKLKNFLCLKNRPGPWTNRVNEFWKIKRIFVRWFWFFITFHLNRIRHIHHVKTSNDGRILESEKLEPEMSWSRKIDSYCSFSSKKELKFIEKAKKNISSIFYGIRTAIFFIFILFAFDFSCLSIQW